MLLGVSQPCERAARGWHNLKLCVDGGAGDLHSRINPGRFLKWRFAVLEDSRRMQNLHTTLA